MSNIARWNPVKAVTSFDPLLTFEDMFRGLRQRAPWRELEAAAPDMRLDVSEDDKSFLVKAEVPGASKDDIQVSIDGNQVAISAEVKRETSKKGDDRKDLYTERYYGSVYRAFTLPNDIDDSKADASYDNGVLTLNLPKKSNGSAHKIKVS